MASASVEELVKQINDIEVSAESIAMGDGISSLMKKAELCSSLAKAVGRIGDHARLVGASAIASTPAIIFPKDKLMERALPHGFYATVAPVGTFLLAVLLANWYTTKLEKEKDASASLKSRSVYTLTVATSIVIAMVGTTAVKDKMVRDLQRVGKVSLETVHNVTGK